MRLGKQEFLSHGVRREAVNADFTGADLGEFVVELQARQSGVNVLVFFGFLFNASYLLRELFECVLVVLIL